MSAPDDYDIADWVGNAVNVDQREFRESVHVTLSAIAADPALRADMVIKGGILLSVRYHSPRFTTDIDFSTVKTLAELDPEKIGRALDDSLSIVADTFEYGLNCRVQSCKVRPANKPNATFPSIEMTVGYAYKGSRKHGKLLNLRSPTVVSIDYSLNETIANIANLDLGHGKNVLAYALPDLIAEKFRALLQQVDRNRYRRQDVFDLHLILEESTEIDKEDRNRIFTSLLGKANARQIAPKRSSLDVAEVRNRAKHDYPTLADEIVGELPDFDMAYEKISQFYRSLPW